MGRRGQVKLLVVSRQGGGHRILILLGGGGGHPKFDQLIEISAAPTPSPDT